METLPPLSLPRHVPREEWGFVGGVRFMSCPAVWGSFAVSLCGGPQVRTSLFVLLEHPNTPARGPPDSYQRPPVSISAMPAQDRKDRR